MPTKSKARKGNKPMPTNKKQSKAKKLLNWLKPTSPAKGALLFAIVFAVIGGSYTAYKSFAASNVVVVDIVKAIRDKDSRLDTSNVQIDNISGSKSLQEVAQINNKGHIFLTYPSQLAGNYKLCIIYQTNGSPNSAFGDVGIGINGVHKGGLMVGSTTYTARCESDIVPSGGGIISFHVEVHSGSWNFKVITVEKL